MNNLAKRTLSAVILAPVVLGIIWLGGILFQFLVIAAGVIMLWEWNNITRTARNRILWLAGGLVYVVVPCVILILLRNEEAERFPTGLFYILWIITAVWATDIGAYFAGKAIGGPKIAPRISPNKTWAGLFGGMALSGIACFLLFRFLFVSSFDEISKIALISIATISILLAVVAQAGDFFESWVKRRFGVKDSGNIIPGHGGLLDRLDGLLFVTPVFAAIIYFLG